MEQSMRDCPLCGMMYARLTTVAQDVKRIDCERCGSFAVTDEFLDDVGAHLPKLATRDQSLPARVAYSLHLKSRGHDHIPLLSIDDLENSSEAPYRPSLDEQADNLIRLVCDRAEHYGNPARINPRSDLFRIGATSASTVGFVAHELVNRKLLLDATAPPISDPTSTDTRSLLPTFGGWDLFDNIVRRGGSGSRAFLAMPFNRSDLDGVWLPRLREAVDQTGFKLMRVDDEPKPGIIDVRMRQEIRDARFVIVDLTYSNLGAYWEAGFAEGLGKPVVYTCREADQSNIHFDTAHLQRIIWSPENLHRAQEQLIAMIRLSVPGAR